MALKKTTIDVQAADGLQQKIDPRRLPTGKSAKALNLVKNKQGRLEKRLGFQRLNGADPFGFNFQFLTGINLGTWNNNVLGIGRGPWSPTGANVTALSQYSDDLAATVRRGHVPDVKVIVDSILADTPTFAMSPTMVHDGDIAVMVWLNCSQLSVGPQTGNVYWAAFELSTGDIVRPATKLYTGSCVHLRLAVVGNTFVVCYTDASGLNSNNIYCQTITKNSVQIGANWTNWTNIISSATGFSAVGAPPFDMRSATGDTTDFVIAWEDNTGGDGAPTGIKVERRQATNPNTVDATFVVNNNPNNLGITAIGVRADVGVNNRCAVAYYQPTNGTYPTPGTAPVIHAATCVYPSMGFVNGTSSNDTLLYTAPNVQENPPLWLDVAYNGNTNGQLNALTWTVAHTPWGAVWNNLGESGGVTQGRVGRTVSAAPVDSRCAKIILNQFQDGANAIAPIAFTSGVNARKTHGVTLASRGIEANGIVYWLGWVPSTTQGEFVMLAFDQSANPRFSSNCPMRPVANLQTRLALADPGDGTLFSHIGIQNCGSGPNGWTGGSEFTLTADTYSTSYVAYISGTAGQRMQPAYGQLQMAPVTGYPTTQWGSLAAIGGGLPVVFDGQSVFEQSYLWAPESIVVVMGSVLGPTPNIVPGPQWTNDQDAYTWIFTWEQFDAQGNFHISARSTPVTIKYFASGAPPGQLGTGANGIYNPTFYIPTLGVTMRANAASTNAFAQLLPAPTAALSLGAYRTALNGLIFFRITDRFFNGSDPLMFDSGELPPLTFNSLDVGFVSFQDNVSDSIGTPSNVAGGAHAQNTVLDDGTHPLLYGDGTNGAPGSLDNFCPPSSAVMVRHKERLFVARGNQVLFTKARGEDAGPGYNEQVNAFFVGDDTPIIGMESMDDKLVIFKPSQLFYVSGDGPEDDGSGSSFQNPQPIPTDAGCSDPSSIRSTPEGLYFMSTAGLRMLSRSLSVEYVGGPVENELAQYPDIRSVVLYPGQNRVVFAPTLGDQAISGIAPQGELLVRDYVLDAWTTAQITDGGTFWTPAALAVANAPSIAFSPNLTPYLYVLMVDGSLWRERDPNSPTPYSDGSTYVSWTWISPPIKQQDGSRFRLWDMVTFGQSTDPHGLLIRISIDDGDPAAGNLYSWVWSSGTTNNIAPGGVVPLPLTRLRSYDGRFGATFQVQVMDVSDPASSTGEGLQLLGLSLSLGVAPGPYKLPPGNTQ